jgi:hypothetical protein
MGSTPAQAQDHLAPVLITSEHALPHQPLRRGPDRRDTIGEPCARRLAYEVTLTPVDDGKAFDSARLRTFDAGHHFET